MDIQFYRSAVAQQFPRADLSGFRLLGEGGGFYVFETDSGLAWRMLKQPAAEAGLDVEIRLLPQLADAVSLPVPCYEYLSDRAVMPRFVGYHKIEGVPFTRERLDACRSDRPMRQLAEFLTELHGFSVGQAQAFGVPLRAPAARRTEWMQWNEQIRQHVFPLLDEQQRTWAERVMFDLLNDEAMNDYVPALTHNDLWSEHILFDPEREALTGIIDFESASIGDPASDWVALWLDFGSQAIERLLVHYQGPVNATLDHRIARLASYVPLNEISCGILYDDRASWQAGWKHIRELVR